MKIFFNRQESLIKSYFEDIKKRTMIRQKTSDDLKLSKRGSRLFTPSNNRSRLSNTKEELKGVPSIIISYLEKNNVCLVTFKNIESVQIIKAALLKKAEKGKDFNFHFNEEQDFYFFITKELNPNYLKPIITSANVDRKKRFQKDKKETKEKESNVNKIENI